ncbi:hypothetical protein HPB51_003787 [Rhipicephalus microplus]|uniref:Uncharacterized protein n=1 Tax=Rhipicephalus microplus TaxID=6941 RepID=A0A9J6DFS8_RHIMP|nr:hypothetical protein HPB51_003787 [Rhipicephalus microplus]
MYRAKYEGTDMQDFWLGLLSYQATPLEDGRSPGELLQGRRLRTRLPDFRRQNKTTVYKRKPQNTGAKSLPGLQKGQVVWVHDKHWTRKAQVVGPAAPRSYRVLTEDNKLLRRNRKHLSVTLEPLQSSALESDESDSECVPVNEHEPSPRQQVPAPSTSYADGRYTPRLRRSNRNRRPPNKLHYDRNLNQVNDMFLRTDKQRKMYRARYACTVRTSVVTHQLLTSALASIKPNSSYQ